MSNAPRQEHHLQEAILAARGNAKIVQMLLTGMMTIQPDVPHPKNAPLATNRTVDHKAKATIEPGQSRPRFQFAEAHSTRNGKAGPLKAGQPCTQAKRPAEISLAILHDVLADLFRSLS